jgi:hypothetical protein
VNKNLIDIFALEKMLREFGDGVQSASSIKFMDFLLEDDDKIVEAALSLVDELKEISFSLRGEVWK